MTEPAHRLAGSPPGAAPTRLWCECRSGMILGTRWYPIDGTEAWSIGHQPLHRTRTGPLAARFRAHADIRRVGDTNLVSPVGMMLVLLGHTQHRGQHIPVDDLWDEAVLLVGLGGPLAGTQLLLERAGREESV